MQTNSSLSANVARCEAHKSLAVHSEVELIALVRDRGLGWKLALNELLGRHREWLVNHCTRRLGNRQDAHDIAQQVMLRAWQAIDRFEGRSAFRTWLYAIATNQCLTYAVKRMRYVQVEHIERLIDLHLEGTASSAVEQLAVNQAVAVALDELSDTSREVLWLRFFQDLSLEDIAATLAISLSAAKMRLYRALDQFRCAYLRVIDMQAA